MTPGRLVVGALLIGLIIASVMYLVKPQPSGVWLGISIFVFGWIITGALTVRDRIKRHTFDLIFRTRFEQNYIESVRSVRRAFKDIDIVSMAEARRISRSEQGDDIILRTHTANLFNFYEILAISVYYKDADEHIIKEYFYDILNKLYMQLQHFVPIWREKYPEALIYLEWLYKRWTQ